MSKEKASKTEQVEIKVVLEAMNKLQGEIDELKAQASAEREGRQANDYTAALRGPLSAEVKDFVKQFIEAKVGSSLSSSLASGEVEEEKVEWTDNGEKKSFTRKVIGINPMLRATASKTQAGKDQVYLELKLGPTDRIAWKQAVRITEGNYGLYGHTVSRPRRDGNGKS
jgi:hypothetical protein